MKLYKFRPLGNCSDLERVEQIIEEDKFWCSKLWDLNDPMEGVYKNSSFNNEQIEKTFTEKNEYLICSFSGEKGVKNPILWGYYANGFKGVAIEIEVGDNNVYKMRYVVQKKFRLKQVNAKKIITRKLNNWKHEDEYRFLIKDSINKQKIGKITKIYFGTPYGNLNNTYNIIKNSNSLKKYLRYKDKLISLCENNGIDCEDFII